MDVARFVVLLGVGVADLRATKIAGGGRGWNKGGRSG